MTRVYHYGTVPERVAPLGGAAAAAAQLRLAQRLWNTLVAIERARLAAYRKLMRDEIQERIDALRDRLREAREALQQKRKQARSRRIEDAGLIARIREDKTALAALIEERRTRSAEAHQWKRGELDALADRTQHRIKRARQAAGNMGLFWGSYNDIVQRAETGRKAGQLQFRRFTGEGTLTAQIIGGAAVARAIGGAHTFFQVEDVPGQRWKRARMRIGSNSDRTPVWLDIPIVLHRDIPAAALIKSVSMTRRGGRWSLSVTVTLPDPAPKLEGPRVAIDIGYRKVTSGIRVAYWADATASGEVVVPEAHLRQFETVRSLRSTLDNLRNEFLPVVAAWLQGRELTEEWSAQTTALPLWRSGRRLCALIRWWSEHRLTDDTEIFEHARHWRKQYLHLDNWAANLNGQTHARLREQYRVFAAGIVKRYAGVFIEQFDLRKVAATEPPEEADARYSARQRQVVAPSEFRHALVSACAREGVAVVTLPSAYTTADCHVCQHRCVWDQAEEIMHTCEACGARWDQDENAARNLLQQGLASGGAGAAKDQPVRPRKWDRVRSRSQKGVQGPESIGAAV